MSQQDDEKLGANIGATNPLALPPIAPLPPMPNMDSQLPPAPPMDAPLPTPLPMPLPPAPAMDAPLPAALPPLPSPPVMDAPLPAAPVMDAPIPAALPPLPSPPVMDAPLPAAPVMDAPLPVVATPEPVAQTQAVAPIAAQVAVAQPAARDKDSSYGELWAKRSDKPLPQIYGHIDRIANSEAGSLLDRYADRFGHSLDRDIIVLRKQEIADKVSEVRDSPTVELLDGQPSTFEIDADMDSTEQLLAVENELRSLKPEYQAAKSAGDSQLLAQLRPQLEALMGQRKELQAMIESSHVESPAQEAVVAHEVEQEDLFVSFVSIVDELLGSNLPEDVVADFIGSEDFQIYQQVGGSPDSADEELRAAFFAIVDSQLGNMDAADIQVFVESEQFNIYQTIGNMYQ